MSNNNINYNFKKALVSLLSTVISYDNIYNQLPLQDVDYPFLVYEIKKESYSPGNIFNVIIDIWDNNTDTTNLEQLLDNIINILDYEGYNDDNIVISFYESFSQDVATQESLNRRQINIYANAYKKG